MNNPGYVRKFFQKRIFFINKRKFLGIKVDLEWN